MARTGRYVTLVLAARASGRLAKREDVYKVCNDSSQPNGNYAGPRPQDTPRHPLKAPSHYEIGRSLFNFFGISSLISHFFVQLIVAAAPSLWWRGFFI